jgi:hypothetical protein
MITPCFCQKRLAELCAVAENTGVKLSIVFLTVLFQIVSCVFGKNEK